MKQRKANKNHKCSVCFVTIHGGEVYEHRKEYHRFFDENKWKYGLFTSEHKECPKCVINRAKYKYKLEQHNVRAEKRRANCPDKNFQYVWQGGWDTELGCADGGDQKLECHACNLYCT